MAKCGQLRGIFHQPDDMRMSDPIYLDGFAGIAPDYDALICDIWGVLHNGTHPFNGVNEALTRYRAGGGKVLLLSNAPRPSATVAARLADIGIEADAYDDILTSGDVTRQVLTEMADAGKTCCHIGPEKDADLVDGLSIALVDEAAADVVLFSGMYDDSCESPADYADMLARFQARGLPLICPNPDRTVQFGDRIIYCAGAVAEAYEQAGGTTMWVGKPYPLVYQHARDKLAALGAGGRVLAVGDGPKTDIPGAASAGIDALFVTGGLAGASGAAIDTPAEVGALLTAENTHARYAIRHLVW